MPCIGGEEATENYGHVIQTSSPNKAYLWNEADAEGKSSRKLEELTMCGKGPKQPALPG